MSANIPLGAEHVGPCGSPPETPEGSSAMSSSSASWRRRYALDLAMLSLVLVVLGSSETETARAVHQVAGVLLGIALGLHVAWNWRQLALLGRRCWNRPGHGRDRIGFFVDLLGLVAGIVSVLGGLAISTWAPWRQVTVVVLAHHAATKLFLLAAVLHFGLHARWLWRHTLCWLRRSSRA